MIARRSIRVDTQALFTVSHSQLSPARTSASKPARRQQPHQPNQSQVQQDGPARCQPSSPGRLNLRPLPVPQPPPVPFGTSSASRNPPLFQQSFGVAEPQSPVLAEPEEMDWTPTQSQHRAFSNAPAAGSPSRPFSQAPVQPESGPFWYKVPPAPINPAHKLRNPPRVPVVRNANIESKTQGTSFTASLSNQHTGNEARSTAVEFQQPTFFAPTKDDERNSLAEMLNKSFSLGNEQEEDDSADTSAPMSVVAGDRRGDSASLHIPLITGLSLLLWTITMLFTDRQIIPYIKEIKLCASVVAGGLALGHMGQQGDLANGNSGLATWLWPVVEVSELALLCYVGWETWVGQTETTGLGFGVLLFGFLKSTVVAIKHPSLT